MIDFSKHTDDYLSELTILATLNLVRQRSLPGRQDKSIISGVLEYYGAAGSAQSYNAYSIKIIARSAILSSLVSTLQD